MSNPEWARHKPKTCPVCVDGDGFKARECPGCRRRKILTPTGCYVGLTAAQAQAYRDLRRALRVEGEDG